MAFSKSTQKLASIEHRASTFIPELSGQGSIKLTRNGFGKLIKVNCRFLCVLAFDPNVLVATITISMKFTPIKIAVQENKLFVMNAPKHATCGPNLMGTLQLKQSLPLFQTPHFGSTGLL